MTAVIMPFSLGDMIIALYTVLKLIPVPQLVFAAETQYITFIKKYTSSENIISLSSFFQIKKDKEIKQIIFFSQISEAQQSDLKKRFMNARIIQIVHEKNQNIYNDYYSQLKDLFQPISDQQIYKFPESVQKILLFPGSGSQIKNWDLGKYISLFIQLRSYLNKEVTVSLVLGIAEIEYLLSTYKIQIKDIHQYLADKYNIDLSQAGSIIMVENLHDLADLVEHHDLIVSNDSGVMHLGTFFNKYLLSIFGPTLEEEWGSGLDTMQTISKKLECRPCFDKQKECSNRSCLDISVDTVLKKVKEIINQIG